MRRFATLLGSLLLVLFFSSACSAVVYVKHDSPGPSFDGESWDTAYHTVQEGLNAAEWEEEVWVAAGAYKENVVIGNAALYGGFAGNEIAREQRDWRANRTILDGGRSGSVIQVAGKSKNIVIDGFVIRDGRAESGGGIYYERYAGLTISHNIIEGNAATHGSGGGIYCRSGTASIRDNFIIGNSAISPGGGIFCGYYPDVTISGNTIVGNAAAIGGGIFCSVNYPDRHVSVANNILAFNSSKSEFVGSYPESYDIRRNDFYEGDLTEPPIYTGNGNIAVDPMFADWKYGKVHLQPGSPCIDAGDDAAAEGDIFDIDGQQRVIGAHVDIGADESDGETWEPGSCRIVRVAPDGDDENDGSTWELAKLTVQSAIDAGGAAATDVWVAAGTYAENVQLPALVHLYGGFSGSETDRRQRDPAANETILDGGHVGSVVTASGCGYLMSTIDGFTITNGVATSGGGIMCSDASPVIAHNVIRGNAAYGWPFYDGGGGIYCRRAAPAITANTILDNSANSGGGICALGSSPVISGNVIEENAGGGIFCSGSISPFVMPTHPIVTGNTITGNLGSAGIYVESDWTAISGNTIAGNRGSGIHILRTERDPLDQSDRGPITITDNHITGNGAYLGGGIYYHLSSYDLEPAKAVISRNVISDNRANDGGGIYCAGTASITANEISGNGAYDTNAVCCLASSDLINNVILSNTQGYHSEQARTLLALRGATRVINNTIAYNAADSIIGQFDNQYDNCLIANNIIAYNTSGIAGPYPPGNLSRNCVYGNMIFDYADPALAESNISVDPLVESFGGVHIQPDSPCVDAGDDSIVGDDWVDLDDQPRIQGAHVDIGADESDGTPWQASPPATVRVSPEGNDELDGSDWGSAKRTIQAAIDAVELTGGEVWTKTGSYEENVELAPFVHLYGGFAGTETDRRDRDWERNPVLIEPNTEGPVVSADGCTRILVDGLTIRGGRGADGQGVECQKSEAQFVNNTIADNAGDGIHCESSRADVRANAIRQNARFGIRSVGTALTVSGSSIESNNAMGIYADRGEFLSPVSITRSAICGNGLGGINIRWQADALIEGNLIAHNSYDGIRCYPSGRIINNTVADNRGGRSGWGILAAGTVANNVVAFNWNGIRASLAHSDLRNNCAYANAGYDYETDASPDPTNISADPLFAHAADGDYHLLPGSPCIDAADPASAPDADLDGVSRPRDGDADGAALPDMGCYESPNNYVTAAGAKALADGSPVGVSACVSTASFPERFYVESTNRIWGIGVLGEISSAGKWVTVEGEMATVDGERVVAAAEVIEGRDAPVPAPWFVNFNGLGGGPCGLQEGVTDWRMVRHPISGQLVRRFHMDGGASNIGLLMKVAGAVTNPGKDFFYLDGSSSYDDGNRPVQGVRVDWLFTDPMPTEGAFVEIVGISACTIKHTHVVRFLRPISAQAVRIIMP